MGITKAELIDKKQLTDDVIELIFKPNKKFVFQAGQFITIKVKDKNPTPVFRGYSISSKPQEDRFELCIKLMENGRGSTYLKNLNKGDEIEFLGPNGHFLFKNTPQKKSIFIATGTGLAPIKSIIENELLDKNYKGDLLLLFGVRYVNGIFYKNTWRNFAKKYPNFKYEITVSRPEDTTYTGNKGRVTDLLEKISFNPQNTNFYLCGLKEMIDSVNEILTAKKVPTENIFFEKFD
ncbi:MAG: FAD-dependent oxidoreductase [Candidatus Gracilibacteria bacterium]|jgi:CDP-4-dehydro-6-deoxyglucose reductase